MQSFIFGQNTPWSYEDLQKKRSIADELAKSNMNTPRNVGEGLAAIGRALAFRSLDKKATKRDAELKGEFQSQWDSAFGGFGSGASGGGPAFAPPSMPVPPPDPNEALGNDAMAALGKPAIHDHGSHPGQSHADWLKYSNQGATRNDPLDPGLVSAMSFLPEMGVTMEVFSGGQEAAGQGGSRTGSTRHDHGKAADAFFYKDGVRLDPSNPAHVPILQEIVKRGKAAGVTGWGAGNGYMQPGSVHLGFGAPAVWGAGGSGANAAPWLVEAYNGAPAGSAPASTGAPGGGMDMAMLADLAGSPYATPGQKAVVAALMQQQMDAMDPMRAIEMQKAQLELAQMQNPQADPMAAIELEQARLDLEQDRAGTGADAATFGTTLQFFTDQDGKLSAGVIGNDGSFKPVDPPGGGEWAQGVDKVDAGTKWVFFDKRTGEKLGEEPKDLRGAETEKAIGAAEGEAAGKAITGMGAEIAQAEEAIALIDSIVTDPALPSITGMFQGRVPPMTQAGTDLNVKIQQLQGKAFLEAFESLKGGGAITEREGQAATEAMARLNRAQSQQAYQEALNELKGIMQKGVERARGKASAAAAPSAPTDEGVPTFNPQTGEWE